jgi:outer membrane protein assembly factor BamE
MAEPMRQRPTRLLAAFALAGTLSLGTGCLYRMDIKQGNYLDPTQVMQLEKGMTKSQVRFLLGTPQVPSGFDNDRWNYYLYEKRGKNKPYTTRLTVWFTDDKVERFERPEGTETIAAAIAEQNAKAAAAQAARSAPPSPATPRASDEGINQ